MIIRVTDEDGIELSDLHEKGEVIEVPDIAGGAFVDHGRAEQVSYAEYEDGDEPEATPDEELVEDGDDLRDRLAEMEYFGDDGLQGLFHDVRKAVDDTTDEATGGSMESDDLIDYIVAHREVAEDEELL